MLKELYCLIEAFCHFTAWMEGHATTGSYDTLWEVLPALELLVSEYKRFAAHYSAGIVNSQHYEVEGEEPDMKYNYILLSVNNALSKLEKYQKLLPQSPAYAASITMNPILR